jgi:type IV secretion system protein VirB4
MRHADPSDTRLHPLVGHWDEQILLNADGSLMAVRHVAGFPAELAGAQATLQAAEQDNYLVRGLADERVEIWDHFVRRDRQQMPPLPPTGNWFADRFDRAYHELQDETSLFANDLFVTVVMHPSESMRPLSGWLGKGSADPEGQFVQDFRAVLQKLDASLARYGCRPLGIREENGAVFSEAAEALHVIANARYRPIGLARQRMGRFLMPERMVFGHTDFHVLRAGAEQFGTILSFHDYPARTRPGMFRALRLVPFPIVLTSAFRFHQRTNAVMRISRRAKQMRASEDAAESQIAELVQDSDDVQSGRSVYVNHHWSAALYASNLEELDRRVAQAQSLLSDVGITSTRESLSLIPAYRAQLPGNRRWRTRPGALKSVNAVSLAAKHGVPRGEERGRWGAPVMVLRTTADTRFNFHFHVQGTPSIPAADLGHCLLIGRAGSGKTSLMASACLLALRNADVRVVVVDKDYGMSVMVRAAGGSYMVLPSGSPSGLAPLKALQATPDDCTFLKRWLHALILSDGSPTQLTSEEDARLDRAISLQMRMPVQERGIAGIAAMLGYRNPSGAGARLRRWCRGEGLGWAFDNETDDLDMDKRIVGFETSALLRDQLVAAPTLSYLFHRTAKLIDGRPFLLAIDEMWQVDRIASFREENNNHLKTLRKQEGAMLLATQSARDALNSPIAHTFREQVPTKIFFGDETASYDDLVNGMGLTDAEYLAVKQLLPNLRHTFLLKRPSGSVLCRFDLSGAMDKVAVVSARESTYQLMNRLIAVHGPDPKDWVPHYERHAPRLAADPSLRLPEAAE